MDKLNSVQLPANSELSDELINQLAKYPKLNIIRLLTLVPECFKPWMDMVDGIYKLQFNSKLREIAICRYGFKTKSAYELFQHRVLALNAGVTLTELEAITSQDTVTNLDSEVNFICQVVDEFEDFAGKLSDETFNRLFTSYGSPTAMQLLMILGHYSCVTRVLNATRIPLEEHNVLEQSSSPVEAN